MEPHKVTESDSHYSHLEKKSAIELIHIINAEDAKVANAVEQTLPEIADLVEKILPRFLSGGRLFYIGAGTSGRLGILDASEIPPTYGLDHDRVIGLIAGGDSAIRKAVEFAEDNEEGAWIDLSKFQLNEKDTVVGSRLQVLLHTYWVESRNAEKTIFLLPEFVAILIAHFQI